MVFMPTKILANRFRVRSSHDENPRKKGAPNQDCSRDPCDRAPTNSTWPTPLAGRGTKHCFVGYKSRAAQGRNFSGSRNLTLARRSIVFLRPSKDRWIHAFTSLPQKILFSVSQRNDFHFKKINPILQKPPSMSTIQQAIIAGF
jgi:hypothetical protein